MFIAISPLILKLVVSWGNRVYYYLILISPRILKYLWGNKDLPTNFKKPEHLLIVTQPLI